IPWEPSPVGILDDMSSGIVNPLDMSPGKRPKCLNSYPLQIEDNLTKLKMFRSLNSYPLQMEDTSAHDPV
ncbi:hypothetical protein Tco_0557681, partial [Tanacetum coccineum]